MSVQEEKAAWDSLPLAPGPTTVSGDEDNPLAPIEYICRKYGPMAGFTTRFGYTVMVSGAAEVREVLFNPARFQRFENLRLLIGNGLLQSEGPYWRAQRRRAQPRFHQKTVDTYRDIMAKSARETMKRWENNGYADGKPFELGREMLNLALPASQEALLGARMEHRVEELNDASFDVMYYMAFLGNPLVATVFNADNTRRARAALKVFNDLIMEVIERQRGSKSGNDLMSILFSAKDSITGEPLNNEQIRDEVATVLLGGHETTSVMLMWTWFCISQNPSVEERLHEEWERVLGGREPSLEDVGKLAYTHAVFQESLRLYPPVWGLARRAQQDDVVGGCRIPKETLLITIIIALHRDPDLWDAPLEFRPERFLPENADRIPKDAYIPFGEGPHTCIGKHFATLEAMVTIPMIGQKYRIRSKDADSAIPHPYVTLRVPKGIPVWVERRSG